MKKLFTIIFMLVATISLKAQMMNKNMYPCIWFNNNAKEAVDFYSEVFDDVKITSENPVVVLFEIGGAKFMALNGGDKFRPNAAVSYFVYCEGSDKKIEHLYAELLKDGEVVMPLGKYDWSPKYAWVQDKFGISWQLDIDAINNPQKVVPTLLFTDGKSTRIQEAETYYTTLFKDSKSLVSYPFAEGSGMPEGTLLFSQVKLNGLIFNFISGGNVQHGFDFTEGNSFVVECATQEEIDQYWRYFSKEGKESMCGWVQDKYGVWWQVVPAVLKDLMSTPGKAQKVTEAFLKMKKFDIETLKKAAE